MTHLYNVGSLETNFALNADRISIIIFPGGKKKQKSKGKTVNLNEFLAGDTPGTTYVPKARTWADEMDNETSNGKFSKYDLFY